MALSSAKRRHIVRPDFALPRNMTIATGVSIYEGAIVAMNGSGELEIPDNSNAVIGVAYENGSAGEQIRVQYRHIERFTLSGATQANNGALVYATSDDTLTYTPGTSIVGRQVDVVSTNTILLEITCGA